MEKRIYSADMLRIWGRKIKYAEQLMLDVEENPNSHDDGSYKIELDPEDFLDLCAGKWK